MQAGEPEDPPLLNSEDLREKGDRRRVELDSNPVSFCVWVYASLTPDRSLRRYLRLAREPSPPGCDLSMGRR
jgi:hypothetical protein